MTGPDPAATPAAGSAGRLHDLMDRAVADLDTPTARIHEGSVRRGGAARRRRRAGVLACSLATTAAVAAVVLPSLTGAGTGTDAGVAHDTGTTAPGTYQPPAGWWDMPGGQMRDRLGELLPDGLTTTDANLGNEDLGPGEEPHGGWLQVDLTDRAGRAAGGINVLLYAPQPDNADGRAFLRQRTTCPGNLAAPDQCTEERDGAGAVVGRSSRWASGGVVVLEVTRLTPDGALVYVAASNSSDDKWGADSSTDRETPPVTLSQLRRIATATAWQR